MSPSDQRRDFLHSVGTVLVQVLGAIQMMAAVSLLFLIGLVLAGTAPTLLGFESFVVYSGSMEPALGVGDLAVVAPTKADEFRVGDIITYRPAQQPTLLVTHRLVGIGLGDQGRFAFQTKGDANNVVDQVMVAPEAVVGRVAYRIQKLGYLVDFAKRPEGRLSLIGIPGLLLGVDYLLSLRRRASGGAKAAKTEAAELVARGRIALNNSALHAAVTLFDQAIASDPRLEEAWLLKAECLDEPDRSACLQAALTVNPNSSRLRRVLEQATATSTATGS